MTEGLHQASPERCSESNVEGFYTSLTRAQLIASWGLAAAVASVGTGVSPSDAQFIELLGAGLRLDPDDVTEIVMSAVQNEALRAA